jgi:glucose 1-dehydrogenase
LAFATSNVYSGIVINGRKMDEIEEVADEIRNEGCDSLAIETDISKEDDCVRLVEEADRAFGRIDGLVNNAGIQRDVPFEETSTEEWYKIIGVDLT